LIFKKIGDLGAKLPEKGFVRNYFCVGKVIDRAHGDVDRWSTDHGEPREEVRRVVLIWTAGLDRTDAGTRDAAAAAPPEHRGEAHRNFVGTRLGRPKARRRGLGREKVGR
jgi:hypothetical protein